MKKFMLALVIVVIGSGFSYITSEAKEKAKVTIKIATLAPKGTSMMTIIEELGAKVEETTNNEVDFKIYSGGVQGDESDVLRKMRIKQLHGGIFTAFALGRMAPAVRVTEIIFVFKIHII